MASLSSLLFLISCLCLFISSHFHASEAQTPPAVDGLSYDFYNSTCPDLESIIRNQLQTVFATDIGQAAALLRIHFHDCFVQGCDASLLLNRTANESSEKDVVPNLTLRAEAFTTIEDLRSRVHARCGRIVSCADITALAARDSVVLSGGPAYNIPLGRRDSTSTASDATVLADLPGPFNITNETLQFFARKNLDTTDTVALSGGHTIGRSSCAAFARRLYPQDPTMDPTFGDSLRLVCPSLTAVNTTLMDIQSPNVFDNGYFVDLINRQTLFTSDQDLFTDNTTLAIVQSFAANQTLFFERFVIGMINMGQVSVLTGTDGEIRGDCAVRNSNNSFISTVVEDEVESLLGF